MSDFNFDDLTDEEIYQIIIDYLVASYKHILLNYLLTKHINKKKFEIINPTIFTKKNLLNLFIALSLILKL